MLRLDQGFQGGKRTSLRFKEKKREKNSMPENFDMHIFEKCNFFR